jgi:hypothetical protein
VAQNGSANSTWTARSSKNVGSRRKVRSMIWSGTTSSPGRISSRSEPAADVAITWVTPTAFSAKTLAR